MAVVETELPEHVREVVLDRVRADTEAYGDFRVGAAPAQLIEHTPLRRREDVGVAGATALSLRHWQPS